MSFRDMTFCRGDGCANFATYPRALTDEVKASARKWWGSDDAPIMQFTEPAKLECWKGEEEPE